MKIIRFYWDSNLQRDVTDLVLTVTRETKTLLIAVSPRNPTHEWRFRKPAKIEEGAHLYPVPRTVKSWAFQYRLVEVEYVKHTEGFNAALKP